MKTAFILVIILAVLACGCTSSVPTAQNIPATTTPHPDRGPGLFTTPHAVPNLLGNWTGPARGYVKGMGYRDTGTATMTLSVTSQNDRVFAGNLLIPYLNGTIRTDGFAGVIAHDGETLRIVEFETYEHNDGWILSENEIELVFIDVGEPQSIFVDSFKRAP
ncbi:MAG: hypothetical protein A4E35_01446 [Methanoregula sp. PtaU1.Bin051]|nr:MAG: hypothetical protein A4E35_01446 [Methanoregula sp. PtaU1.Bin051]